MSFDELTTTSADNPAAIWRILADMKDPGEFAASLDYAMERLAFACDFAPQLRGEDVAAPAKYWPHPIDGGEMVWIPGGSCWLGKPMRKATTAGFFLARRPVTNAQFARFLEATGYEPTIDDPLRDDFLRDWVGGKPADDARPVVWVSYVDACRYCEWAKLTLPGEWLWERAARGSDGRTYPWGEDLPYVPTYRGEPMRRAQVRARGPTAVAAFGETRSPYGCDQLVGNVSEWCQLGELPADGVVRPTPAAIPKGAIGWTTTHAAVRGSAYLRNMASRMASSHRRRLAIGRRNAWTGFRPAFYPPGSVSARSARE